MKKFVTKRYFTFFIITITAIFLPFLKFGGNHFFLLSFDKSALHLFFVKFDMQELYLLPFLFIILFLFIFFMTTLGGRIWCGWACPQTIFRVIYRDLIQTKFLKIFKNSQNKQKAPQGSFLRRAASVAIWSALSLFIACNFMWYFVPPEDFFSYLKSPAEHKILLSFLTCIALWLIYDVCFLAENFCVYICPYARVQSVMFDNDTIQVIYDESRGGKIYENGVSLGKKPVSKPVSDAEQCVGCEACVRICPTHIDIRKGMQLECINCLECADACAKTMAKFSLPSLISWTSENSRKTRKKVKFLRFRTAAYAAILAVALTALALMSGKKENMLLNINRTSELYSVNKAGEIENSYVFLFQNTDSRAHEFYFDVEGENIKISRPVKPILIASGAKQRVVVTLKAARENFSGRKSGRADIKIRAYAVDDREKISVIRQSVFAF